MAFQGTAEGTVDAKGRACIPAKFREGLEEQGQVMLWYSGDATQPFLMLASKSEYNRVFEREYSRARPEHRAQVMRRIQVNSEPVELDKSARFVLPEKLAAKAGVRREDKIFFIGCHTYLEVWQLAQWNEQEAQELAGADGAEIKLDFAPDPAWLFDAGESAPDFAVSNDTESGDAP